MLSHGLSCPSWMMLGIDWAGLVIRCGCGLICEVGGRVQRCGRLLEVGWSVGPGLDVLDPYWMGFPAAART
jgi:hypothetical protein